MPRRLCIAPQVGLQVRDVIDELRRVSQQPLVYVSHPVVVMGEDASDPAAVYPDTGGDALGPDHKHHHRRNLQARAAARGVDVRDAAPSGRGQGSMRSPQDELEQWRQRVTAFGGNGGGGLGQGHEATPEEMWRFIERERGIADDAEEAGAAKEAGHRDEEGEWWSEADDGSGEAGEEGEARRQLLLDPGDVAAAGVSQQQHRAAHMRRPEVALAHINRRIRRTGCKAVFIEPEFKHQVVALAPLVQGRVKERRITTRE